MLELSLILRMGRNQRTQKEKKILKIWLRIRRENGMRRRRNDRVAGRRPYYDYRRLTMSCEKYYPLLFWEDEGVTRNLSCLCKRRCGEEIFSNGEFLGRCGQEANSSFLTESSSSDSESESDTYVSCVW